MELQCRDEKTIEGDSMSFRVIGNSIPSQTYLYVWDAKTIILSQQTYGSSCDLAVSTRQSLGTAPEERTPTTINLVGGFALQFRWEWFKRTIPDSSWSFPPSSKERIMAAMFDASIYVVL